MTVSRRSAASRSSDLLVFAYGNPSRGDDAVGPLLLEHLEKRTRNAGAYRIELIGDFQLQVEHALDLKGRDLVLFVDASVASPAPFDFSEIEPRRDNSYTSHAMTPQSVLDVYGKILRSQPPPSFLLSIRGESFELGASLSSAAREHLDAACTFVDRLLASPQPDSWRLACDESTVAASTP